MCVFVCLCVCLFFWGEGAEVSWTNIFFGVPAVKNLLSGGLVYLPSFTVPLEKC